MRPWLLAGAMLVTSCGYRIVSGSAPFGKHALVVVPFSEPDPIGISSLLTEEISRLLAASGAQLAFDERRADAVLEGKVIGVNTGISPTAIGARVTAYQLRLEVAATLRTPDGEVLWTQTVDASEDFLPGQDADGGALATEAKRRNAMRRAATRLAEQLHDRLLLASSLGRKTL